MNPSGVTAHLLPYRSRLAGYRRKPRSAFVNVTSNRTAFGTGVAVCGTAAGTLRLMDQFGESDRVTLEVWTADAVVLFDWLMRVEFDGLPITHRAQKQALMDLLTSLERDTLAMHATEEEIRRAQEQVAKDMGW